MNDPQGPPTPCLALVPADPPGKVSSAGRPAVITPEIRDKLEYVFAFGGADKEARLFADIGLETLYHYQRNNPESGERKDLLKSSPILKARMTLVNTVARVPHQHAMGREGPQPPAGAEAEHRGDAGRWRLGAG